MEPIFSREFFTRATVFGSVKVPLALVGCGSTGQTRRNAAEGGRGPGRSLTRFSLIPNCRLVRPRP